LQEIGYEDIFSSDEVNEIKALYEKASEEMKENLNNPNLANSIEEKLLADESLSRLIQEESKHNENDEEQKRNNLF
jgi:hypothetical protein